MSKGPGEEGEGQLGVHMLLTIAAQPDLPVILGFVASPFQVGHHGIHTCLYHADHNFSMQIKVYHGAIDGETNMITIRHVVDFGKIRLTSTLAFGLLIACLEGSVIEIKPA